MQAIAKMKEVIQEPGSSQDAKFLEILDRLMSLDITEVKDYMRVRMSYEQPFLDEMEREYKIFLAMSAVLPKGEIPVSLEIDQMWHTHILHTKAYHAMCSDLVGHFIHHQPLLTEGEIEEAMPKYVGNTLAFYRRHFGEPDERFWTKDCICYDCCESVS